MWDTSDNLVRLASTNRLWRSAFQDDIKSHSLCEPYAALLIDEFTGQVTEAMTSPNAGFVVSQALKTFPKQFSELAIRIGVDTISSVAHAHAHDSSLQLWLPCPTRPVEPLKSVV
jgi:hypothetical protein